MGNYGQGKSTGMEQTALKSIVTGFVLKDMEISDSDAEVLRPLAEKVAQIACSERMKEIHRAWKSLNDLTPLRPVFFSDPENGWNEIVTETQMQCSSLLGRHWEMALRKKIFCNDEMQDDTPITNFLDVPYTVGPEDWGLSVEFERTQSDGAAHWDSPVKDYEKDLAKIDLRMPEIDMETTNACLSETQRVLGDILSVRLKGTWWWTLGLTMPFIFLRGLENLMLDMYDHPDEVKELLSRISSGTLQKLDWLEQKGLLSLNNDATYVGSGGYGFTDSLPGGDFSETVRCKDMWGFTESQETVGVSPKLYEEFIFPYEKPIMERFGLTCYGCCEPVDSRWDIIKRHHNLRRVSCSPWADFEKMAEYLKNDYIFSMKVNPADIAVAEPDFQQIRENLRRDLEITKGCVVEVIMKDNHTIAKHPENLIQWCRIAREEIDSIIQ
jgi:hypothetical protein